MRGNEIHFEGPDGCGKGTQISMASAWLLEGALGDSVVNTCEPWPGDQTEALIRDSLDVDQPHIDLSPQVRQRAFIRNRLAHRDRCVIPALKEGRIVLQDRSWVSTISYLVAESGMSYEDARDWVLTEHQEILGSSWSDPDLVLIFMLPPQVALDRMIASGKKMESFDSKLEFQERVNEAYVQFSVDPTFTFPRVIIDALPSEDEVHRRVQDQMDRLFRDSL